MANRPGAGAPNVDELGNLKLRKGQTLTKGSNGRKYLHVIMCTVFLTCITFYAD